MRTCGTFLPICQSKNVNGYAQIPRWAALQGVSHPRAVGCATSNGTCSAVDVHIVEPKRLPTPVAGS